MPTNVDRRPLISYLRIQRNQDRRMIAVLSRSTMQMEAELRRLAGRPGVGAAVRREQIASAQAAVHREIASLWRQLGYILLAGREEAAAASVESMYPRNLLRAVMPAADVDALLRSAEATARSTVDAVEARMSLSRIPLSERVYRSRDLAAGRVDAIVDAALARGASAAELARDVRRFIRPDTRGGIRYAALRLGRTELNNAFHAMQVQTAISTPWTTGVRWNLSGSHPRPDECNEYADADNGYGAGVWDPEEVPAKPHPNCLCFMTSETVDRRTFIAQFQAGAYDDVVNQMTSEGSMTFR